MKNKRVLIVGAGGFVGGYLVEEGLRLGCEVWAGVRASTKRDRLPDPRIHFIVFDYEDPSQMAEAMKSASAELAREGDAETSDGDAAGAGKWDYIIWNLGATKVVKYADFNLINYEYLKRFTGAVHQTGMIPEKMVLISSLSVLGAQHERDYAAYTEDMIPQPNTRYGASKLKAELWMATAGIPYVIVRATGVYGPWDEDYAMMLESIRKGWDFGVGFRKQLLTFVYAADLAKGVYAAAEKGRDGEVYHMTESRAYTQKEFRKLAMGLMDKKFVMPVRLPLWIVRIACGISEKIGALRGKPATLNSDKYRILKQRNWNCSGEKARRELGFEAQTGLKEGLESTIKFLDSTREPKKGKKAKKK